MQLFLTILFMCSIQMGPFSGVKASGTLTLALKMAQCRAHCLNKFTDLDSSVQEDGVCKESSNCFFCWQTCKKLTFAYPIWSFNCGRKGRCNEGCDSACEFLSTRREEVVPLSQHNSRLTLIFGGTSARWRLSWGDGVSQRQRAVFALFTQASGQPWQLRLQTAATGALLEDVSSGTELKLVAVAESGMLSVIITPFKPSQKGAIVETEDFPWNRDSEVRGGGSWPLQHSAVVTPSGLVAARVSWQSQRPLGSDYLVTWEVAAGGLKGHLYTNLPVVDLKLWPNTVYKVQVEVVSGPLAAPHVSQLLILDTNNLTAEIAKQKALKLSSTTLRPASKRPTERITSHQEPFQPLVSTLDSDLRLAPIIGGVLSVVALVAALGALWACGRRRRRSAHSTLHDASSANSRLSLNRSVADLTLDEGLGVAKGDLLAPPKGIAVYALPFGLLGPQNTVGLPSATQNHYVTIHRPTPPLPSLKAAVPPFKAKLSVI